RNTEDPMAGQGSYYYSLGLLDVDDFKIGIGSRTAFAEGDRGTFWMDYVVESYDKTAQFVVADASWLFFALQFPSGGKAMMVNQLDTGAGRLRVARLFRKGSATHRNGSRKPVAQWNSNDIRITPIRRSSWTSRASGQTYAMEYRIRLAGRSKARRGDLRLRTVRKNQEIIVGNTVKYEGLMTVRGTLGGKRIRGQAWAELQPVGHL
ncbi:MAG TPA: lipocalin family protein, partial [Thermoleophilia bacterium]|nr:lipocalin family protein [Thermoleophilia bacterium]